MTIISASTLPEALWFTSSHSNDHGGNCVEAARLTGVTWFTSSHSDAEGGNCVEAAQLASDWFTSSFSDNRGGACVEGAHLVNGGMAVRDSKDPEGPALLFSPEAWSAFTSAVTNGDFPTT